MVRNLAALVPVASVTTSPLLWRAPSQSPHQRTGRDRTSRRGESPSESVSRPRSALPPDRDEPMPRLDPRAVIAGLVDVHVGGAVVAERADDHLDDLADVEGVG